MTTLEPVGGSKNWDWLTPGALLCLGAVGVAFIYSAQLPVTGNGWLAAAAPGTKAPLNGWSSQIIWLTMGIALYVAVSMIDYRFWLGVAHWFYGICLVLLVAVLIKGIGKETYGSQRWIRLGPASFQPSEVAKIGVLLMCASILVRSKVGSVSQSIGVLGKLALAAGVPMFLIFLQPDLKSAIVLPPMVFSMLYVSRLTARFFAAALVAFLVVVSIIAWDIHGYAKFLEANKGVVGSHGGDRYASWVPLHDYQRDRILTFADPNRIDPLGIGWNQRQSMISVGSGGLTGEGWTQGTQARLGYLPRSVAPNDFIFSVIAEETGFLGSITVLVLFAIVLFNGIRIAGLARDRLGTVIAIGVTALFTVHVFVNIAMTVGLVPITGIPLPFVSYGGSFVLSCCLLQGLVQSVYRYRRQFL